MLLGFDWLPKPCRPSSPLSCPATPRFDSHRTPRASWRAAWRRVRNPRLRNPQRHAAHRSRLGRHSLHSSPCGPTRSIPSTCRLLTLRLTVSFRNRWLSEIRSPSCRSWLPDCFLTSTILKLFVECRLHSSRLIDYVVSRLSTINIRSWCWCHVSRSWISLSRTSQVSSEFLSE